MIRGVLLAAADQAAARVRDRLDVWAVQYLARRRTLPRGLGEFLLEQLAQRYGARVEIVEGPG